MRNIIIFCLAALLMYGVMEIVIDPFVNSRNHPQQKQVQQMQDLQEFRRNTLNEHQRMEEQIKREQAEIIQQHDEIKKHHAETAKKIQKEHEEMERRIQTDQKRQEEWFNEARKERFN